MTTSAWVIEVNEANFDKEVFQRSNDVPVVLDFWAPWCGPCQMLGPILEAIAEERAGAFILAKVNVDEALGLAGAMGVQSIPAVKAARGGKLVLEFTGLLPESQVRDFIDQVCPQESEILAGKAAGLEASDPGQAEAAYREVLAKDKANPVALLGLARLALARGDEKATAGYLADADFVDEHEHEAQRLRGILELRDLGRPFGTEASAREKVQRDPKNAGPLYELGCVLSAAGRYRDALEALLAAGESDPKLAATKVREAMVKIFQVAGVRSELADEFRPKLSRLLY